MKTFVWVLAAFVLVLPLFAGAQDLPSCLVGKWTNSAGGSYVWFLGDGIGRESGPSGVRYFHYDCSGNQVTLNYGGGSNATFEAVCGAGQLELSSDNVTNSYAAAATTLSSCATNLMRLEGAVAVFAADRPEAIAVMVSDLVPAYVSSLPTCQEGGIYMLNTVHDKPGCNVHGTLSD